MEKINNAALEENYEFSFQSLQDVASADESALKGIPSSPGISFGKALIIQPESIIIPSMRIDEGEISSELDRFSHAVSEIIEEYWFVLKKVKKESNNIVSILESNLLIINDSELTGSIKNRIQKGFSVESAIIQEFDAQKKYFKRSRDSILMERAQELDHIKYRLLSALRAKCALVEYDSESIVVSKSVTPADLVNMKESGVRGFITEVGGIASHASILARSFEIPAVIGVKRAARLIPNASELILDGYSGSVSVNPSQETVKKYEQKKIEEILYREKLGEFAKVKTKTADGYRVKTLANINNPEEVKAASLYGADGVGLARTENLIMQYNRFPSENEQYEWYNEIAERAFPESVTLRAFDIGSDKHAEGLPKNEANPALGLRGVRFLLSRQDVFKTQIRAILLASKNRNVRFLLPMISNVKEALDSRKIIEQCKSELKEEKRRFDPNIPVGVMIETPAAALIAEELAECSDFFSIGSNDLTQYAIAVDRTNELVAELFDSFHPAVIRLLKATADAAKKAGIPVEICGELAGHAASTALLIGLGITQLSVSPPLLLELKKHVSRINFEEARLLAERALKGGAYEHM